MPWEVLRWDGLPVMGFIGSQRCTQRYATSGLPKSLLGLDSTLVHATIRMTRERTRCHKDKRQVDSMLRPHRSRASRRFSRSNIALIVEPSEGSSTRVSESHWLRGVSKKSPP